MLYLVVLLAPENQKLTCPTADRGETWLSQGATQSLDIKYVANNEYAQFQIWDFPGDYDTSSGEFKAWGYLRCNRVVGYVLCASCLRDEVNQSSKDVGACNVFPARFLRCCRLPGWGPWTNRLLFALRLLLLVVRRKTYNSVAATV